MANVHSSCSLGPPPGGIQHDFSDKHGKRTKNYGGRYLMSQYSNSGIRENHSRLSPRINDLMLMIGRQDFHYIFLMEISRYIMHSFDSP